MASFIKLLRNKSKRIQVLRNLLVRINKFKLFHYFSKLQRNEKVFEYKSQFVLDRDENFSNFVIYFNSEKRISI